MKFWIITVAILISALIQAQVKTVNLENFFKGKKGAIVIYNQAAKEYIRYNEKRCKERFTPASTFKILNSLIGLETRTIPDENFVIKWDGIEREMKDWNRDHTLASAIKYSVVPYYRELARKIGKEKMQEYIEKIKYGNCAELDDNIGDFWLDNSLIISADEQVEFLRNLYNYTPPFNKRNIDIVKKIIPEEIYSNAKMKFKTGTNKLGENKYIGWLVGYVEQKNNVYYFAFNIEAESYTDVKKLRDETPRNILKYFKIII